MIRASVLSALLLTAGLPAFAQTPPPCGGPLSPSAASAACGISGGPAIACPKAAPTTCARPGAGRNPALRNSSIITTNEHASSTLTAPRSVHAGGGWDPTSIKSPRDAASGLVEDEWYGF